MVLRFHQCSRVPRSGHASQTGILKSRNIGSYPLYVGHNYFDTGRKLRLPPRALEVGAALTPAGRWTFYTSM